MRPTIVKNAVKALPLALSQTKFARKIAPQLPFLNEATRAAISVDYTSPIDRDAALLKVTKTMIDVASQKIVVKDGEVDDSKKSVGSEGAYNPALLQVYDNVVWEYNSPFLWRIEADEISDLYRDCLRDSRSHCEIAVGTGYFLETMVREGRLNTDTVTLMDLNPNTLDICEQRLKLAVDTSTASQANGLSMNKLQYDVVAGKVIGEDDSSTVPRQYDSVAANFLFHCLHDKSKELETTNSAISNIRKLVHPTEGVFFGSTILGKDLLEQDDNPSAKETLEKYNEWGIFGNQYDSFEGIVQLLEDHFESVDVWRSGYCAVWKAKHPKLDA